MAALFKIVRHDKPTEKKIVKAATIDDLISSAKIKLQLTQEKYKIYTDDFTDIDDDEILIELAKVKESKGDQLILTIVPEGISWNYNTLQHENTSTSLTEGCYETTPTSASTSHQRDKKQIRSSSSLYQADDLSIIFPKFSTNIQSALSNEKSLHPRDKRSMVRIVRDYMINDLKNTSHGAAHNISDQIVKKYPKTFIATIGDKSIDAQIQSLRESIYTAVNYQKQSDKDSNLDETDEKESTEKPKKQDEYGCVAYLPVSPSSEVLDLLKEKQSKLIGYYCSPSVKISDEISTLMNDCYYLQRKEIHKEKKLSTIFEHWPYFHNYKSIIQHANQLLGKETDVKWKESLNKLTKPINRWSRYEEIAREVKNRNKKSMADDEKRFVRETLNTAKKYSDNLKNDEPYHAISFGFIIKFMQEDAKFLYVLIDEEVTDEELIQHVPVVNPVLVIRGQDLHHAANLYNVVIEKEIILYAPSFTEGLLITFLSYYVFGIVYPQNIEGTLEAIQRDLRFNKIRDIPPGTFRGLKHLETLLLNNNLLTSLRDGAFAGLTSLRYLYLYKNRISHLDPAVFQGLPRLEQLYLHNNDIKQFDAKVFSSLPAVDRLYLQGNQIHEIDSYLFRNLFRLKRLFLHNNKIKHIPAGSFKDMPALKRLRLDSNALVCDCGLMWLVEMLNVSSVQAAATCQFPSEMLGKSINGMTENDFNCHKPKIMEGPRDVEVKWGGTVKFTCRVAGDPLPEIIWMKNSSKVEPDNRITILEDGSLQINESKDIDIGQYECMAKSEMGEAKSRPARMVVASPAREIAKPEFTATPLDQDVQVGERLVRLDCRARGIPTPNIVWSRNGIALAPNPRYTVTPEGTLIIQNIEPADFGTYRCDASNELGKISATAQIRINVAPSFTIHPENLTIKTGAQALLECIASGSPLPDVKWYKDGRVVTPTARLSIEADGTRIRINHAKESDSGQYVCKATNFLGSKETSAYLTVQNTKQLPPKFKVKPYDLEAIPLTTIELPCRAEGNPKPDIQWKKDGSSLDRFNFRYRVSPVGSLYISNVTREDAARYECTATNENGRVSASAVLTVKETPETVLAPGDRFVRIAFAEASQEVDKAINNTVRALFTQKTGKNNPSDLFRLIRFPDAPTRELARAAEVYERTLINIRKHVEAGMSINHTADYNYKELLSPEHLDLVARLSGCMVHRQFSNCTDMCFHKKYRSLTGTCNNLQNPTWGASNTGFRRILKPIYENGFSQPVGWTKGIKYYGFEKPSARLVSTTVISTETVTLDEHITHMVMQWGQFLDHDMDHATPSVSSESWDGIDCKKSCEYAAPCFPMEVPPNDPRIKNRRCIDFVRSSAVCGSGMTSVFFDSVQPREQINQLTSFIDGSQVYGFNDELGRNLRDFTSDSGKLRVGLTQPGRKPLLPYAENQGVDCRRDPEESDINCFVAGDIRANEQVGLLAMHTLWMREHNRIATELKKLNPTWNGDTLYHEARKIVGAQMQHITYKHWLPFILGAEGMKLLGEYKEYNPNLDPTISNVFATAALRFGHSLINPVLHRLNSSFEPIPQGHLPLHKAFFSPWRVVDEGGIDPLLRGLFATPAKLKKPTENLNSDLTEHLFTVAHAVALDLAAMNIQRSRDHAIPHYLEWREYCNMSRAETFDDLRNEIKDHNVRKKLENLYGHPGNVDVWVGGILEDQLEGAKVGPLFRCLLIEQFTRLRDGDRFWYENPATFTPEQLTQIKQTSLARVLCDNGDDIQDITRNVFVLPKRQGGYVQCSEIPKVDLRMWSTCCGSCNGPLLLSNSVSTSRPRRELNVSYLNEKPGYYDNETITDDPAENLITEERIEGIENLVESLQKTIKQMKKQVRKLEQQCVDNKSFKHGHCLDEKGNKRLNGEVWQKDDCTKCRCEKHQINCITRECAKPNCAKPTKTPGQCCLTCPAA